MGPKSGAIRVILVAMCSLAIQASAQAGPPPPNWQQVNENGFLGFESTGGIRLFAFDGDLYANNEDGLFQMQDPIAKTWTQLVIPTPPSSFQGIPFPSFTPVGDYLYAGDNDQLWLIEAGAAFTMANWKLVTSVGTPAGASPAPIVAFNDRIYGVLGDVASGTFGIWRTGDIGAISATWEQVVTNSFGDPINNRGVDIMAVFNNHIYAGTNTLRGNFGAPSDFGDGVEIWESPSGDAGTWLQVNEDGFGTLDVVAGFAIHQVIGSWAVYQAPGETQEHLYIGTKAHFGAEVWRYAGGGLPGWTNVTPPWNGPCPTAVCFGTGIGVGFPSRNESLAVFEDELYLAEGFPSANLGKYDGSDWAIVVDGPGDPSGPGPFEPENIRLDSLAVHDGRLYVAARESAGGTRGDQVWGFPFAEVVEIDIKPGSDPNSINPFSRGVIPVAILTTEDFDALTVDADSVLFGPDEAEKRHKRAHVKDVDGDGDLDLLLHFRTQDTGIAPGDTEACLIGQTYDGVPVEGCDSVRTVPPN